MGKLSKLVGALKKAAEIPDKVMVDGVMRATRNSKGQLIHPTSEGIENFWRWYGDSPMDEAGRPIIQYHGTTKDFDAFDPRYAHSTTGNATSALGMFTTPSASEASRYSTDFGQKTGNNVLPVYAAIKDKARIPYKRMDDIAMATFDMNAPANDWKNPGFAERLKAREEKAREMALGLKSEILADGHDGAIVRINGVDEYISFDPSQLKSAIGNSGAFDPKNPDITGKIDPRLLAPIAAGAAGAGALMAGEDAEAGFDDVGRAVKQGLDMSTAARMQRAADQGFDTSRALYHGTGNDFEAFAGGRKGVYLSPNPEIADIYAANSSKRWPGESNAGPNVVKALVKGRHLVVSDQGPTGGGWLMDNLAEKLGVGLEGVPVGKRMQYLSDEATRQGYSNIEIQDIDDLGGRQTQIRVINPSDIRSVHAAFDPANIGKNDLLGAATMGGMATAGAVGAGLMGAQAYDFGTPEYDAKIQEFRNRRAAKANIWKELKEAGATIASAIPASIVSDAYRIGGYLSPVTSLDETEQGAQAIQGAMTVAPTGDNRFLNEIGRQVDQFGRDIEPLVDAWQQTPIYKGYKQLPERAQRLIGTASEYLF